MLVLVPTGHLCLDITRPPQALVCGLLVTSAQLVCGVSGPLLDIFYVHSPLNRFQIIATKALTQSLGHFLKLLYFLPMLEGTLREGGVSPAAYPAAVFAALVGTLSGRAILKHLDDGQFRRWSRKLITGVGVVYLGRGLWLLVG